MGTYGAVTIARRRWLSRVFSLGFKVGSQATVWDGEVAGLERGLVSSGEHPRVVLLSDSKAALQAVRKAGRTGKARTRRLGTLMTEIKRRVV